MLFLLLFVSTGVIRSAQAADSAYFVPQILGAQYTLIEQWQDSIHSPYAGRESLQATGNQERTHTFGVYLGMPLSKHLAMFFDVEMFRGEGVGGSRGLGGLTNGDAIRGGGTLSRNAYVARWFLTYDIPLGHTTTKTKREMDQLPGNQAKNRLGFKFGLLGVNDDFDQSRYANSTRTQFMNWSLLNSPAWDYAADTRGYTVGGLVTYANGPWTWRYGVYQMPSKANGSHLEAPINRANEQDLQVTWQRTPESAAVWMLAYRNRAAMGIYDDAVRIAEFTRSTPDIQADDRNGRHKYGFAAGADVPLADQGDTGLFARGAWNDGRTESFAFTEADRTGSIGGQLAGSHWSRPDDRLGLALAVNGLSPSHRAYLAAGGSGFVLGDGALTYGPEQIVEAYYAARFTSFATISADFQLIHHPGYNRDRGPARFLGMRVHLEY
ncbi:MAG: carbohydrate porin [Rhodanobacter sp.]